MILVLLGGNYLFIRNTLKRWTQWTLSRQTRGPLKDVVQLDVALNSRRSNITLYEVIVGLRIKL